ncbi:MAG: ferric reductase-like transmembrane domain-containing protein [Candidatus Pacebacteria bacterium]|nr:ferric reductase-like transmembrane domain-containing protein [Candidatus Paceibacterota bacterium]MBP9851687.1 ferric reductase-like transmembrane domain-containing protein [Candidatus Paceibacterota bacterium]
MPENVSVAQAADQKPFFARCGRTIVYILSAIIALSIYLGVTSQISIVDLRNIRIAELFGFAAFGYLYVALLISPFYFVFPNAPLRKPMLHARRAIGISTFLFAFLHVYISFFDLLQGFAGLPFLGDRQILDMWLGAIALFILFLMAATSFDYFFKKMGKWWGRLHRFVYLAGAIIIVHVIAVGSHFTNLSRPIPVAVMTLVFGLLALQSFRFAKLLEKKTGGKNINQIAISILLFLLLAAYFYMLFVAKSASIHRH